MGAKSNQKSRLRLCEDISQIEPAAWDACAAAAAQPFLRHAFLCALEQSGAVCPETGWLPQHLILENAQGVICAVMPLYLKAHSQGEYVFDHAWAEAFHRAGGNYYPKLLCAVPFTPVSGKRVLCHPSATREHEAAIISGACALVEKMNVSSLHINFLPQDDWQELGAQGFLRRTDQQFHWCNQHYPDFDAFLDVLASRKRKNLKRERQRALENVDEVEWLTGGDLRPEHWDAFFGFYEDTSQRKWGQAYLGRDFFARIHDTMPGDVLLIMAKRQGRYIAGALNFIGGDALYGRNWGCIEDHPFLHFEICYYQAIDFAIARGLARVEAGAQGAHKLARGYEPTRTYSAHYIAHAGLRGAIAEYLASERQYVDNDIDHLQQHTPFKQEIK